MPEGVRRLAVAVASDENGVTVTIADNGPGIEPANIARLFEPFFTTKPQGMGMGLQICRATIEVFGGTMSVHNNDEGGGATFAFTLPAHEDGES